MLRVIKVLYLHFHYSFIEGFFIYCKRLILEEYCFVSVSLRLIIKFVHRRPISKIAYSSNLALTEPKYDPVKELL